MPPVKFTEIVTFSSEDPNNPAENLLKPETYRKWKCAPNDKQASVTMKIEKMVKIRSIDLANDGSAFVEVLVGREGSGEFQVLLVASSFMTPIESRNNENTNRVRMFGPEKLNKNIAEQKWDRVKVVCTQPFNKNVQYGLSFITINAAEETSSTPEINLGKFSLKEEDSGDPISVGSWFARRKETSTPASPASGAAAIRAASASFTTNSPAAAPTSLKRKAESVNAPDVGFYQLKKKERPASPSLPSSNRDPDQKQRHKEKPAASPTVPPSNKAPEQKQRQPESNSHIKKENKTYKDDTQSAKEKYKQERRDDRGSKEDKKRKVENDFDCKKNKNNDRDESRNIQKNKKEERKPNINKDEMGTGKKNVKSLPFRSLMKDVVFVMSGYQNPRRSQLRDKLLEMGAKYKPDWDDSCSHLICAFSNTPKYVQVKGKGKIVTHRWIEDCHSKKIKYPWRRYQLVQDDEPESEEEILSEELIPKATTSDYAEPEGADLYGGDTDTDNENTDDEIERALENQKKESAKKSPVETIKIKQEIDTSSNGNVNTFSNFGHDHKIKKEPQIKEEPQFKEEVRIKEEVKEEVRTKKIKLSSNDDDYDAETDVDEENTSYLKRVDTSSMDLPSLGNYLSGKNFFMYGKMDNQKRRMLQRYIIAFNGTIHEYMSEDVQFVITEDEWDDNFDNALNDNPSLQFVKPTWIWRCSDRQKFVPHQPFMVVPRE